MKNSQIPVLTLFFIVRDFAHETHNTIENAADIENLKIFKDKHKSCSRESFSKNAKAKNQFEFFVQISWRYIKRVYFWSYRKLHWWSHGGLIWPSRMDRKETCICSKNIYYEYWRPRHSTKRIHDNWFIDRL